MLLSQYCQTIRTYIEQSLDQINRQGYTQPFNDKYYTRCADYLDDCVLSLVQYIMLMQEELERDIDMSEAFRQSGIVQGYLDNTGILGKMVKDQNPLKSIFK